MTEQQVVDGTGNPVQDALGAVADAMQTAAETVTQSATAASQVA